MAVIFIFLLLLLKVLDKGFCDHHFLQEISVLEKYPPQIVREENVAEEIASI